MAFHDNFGLGFYHITSEKTEGFIRAKHHKNTMSYDTSAIVGATLSGAVALTGLGVLNKAAKMLDDDTDPEDLPKKSGKTKRQKTWY